MCYMEFCPQCQGKGWALITHPEDGWSQRRDTCPLCLGDGLVVHEVCMEYQDEVKARFQHNPDDEVKSMSLPGDHICRDCTHIERCTKIFGQDATSKVCQFYPNKFYPVTT